ncbi:MAG: MBL fold metallo-hydrolase [Anaerolineae bacterium]
MSQPLILKTADVGPWPVNAYALICPATGQSVLLDPGADPETLLSLLAGSTPVAIWLTHTHPDHIGALDEMRQRLNVPVAAHPGDHYEDPRADVWLNDGDILSAGQHTVRVYHAPGHIGDQVCFALDGDNRVIVGDTIFDGGPGKTWSAEGFQTTLQTLRRVVMPWPDDTICYPGHGSHFMLGTIRPAVEAFLRKAHPPDFFGDATWDM